jgi:hypothetical protein
VEALRAAAEDDGLGPAEVPASLRDAVLARARRAGPEVETLLRAAVVAGAAVDLEVVAALLDLPVSEVAARAERALAARLLVEDEAGTGAATRRPSPTSGGPWSWPSSAAWRRWRRPRSSSSAGPPTTTATPRPAPS